jgi:D-glycero-alpha-D-manno-heptose 1-phosphate guanylyltransferase
LTTAVVLAGGLGTRLRSAVPNMPKPMAPVDGRPFLACLMDYWISQGVTQFVVSVGYMKEVIMDYFGSSYRSIPIAYAIEETPLGTGGGLLLAAQGIMEPFLVLNGDTFFEVDLVKLLKIHIKNASDWTFSLFRTSEFGRYMGMEVSENGKIISLKMDSEAQNRLANGGAYLVSPSSLEKSGFKAGEKFSLEDELLPALMSQECNLFGIEFKNSFIDIGIPQDYLRAADVLNK